MSDVTWPPMYFDRRASQTLMAALDSKGPFAFLTRIGREVHLADLQFRGSPKTTQRKATLYCGLTKVIELFEHKDQLWLEGGKFWLDDPENKAGWKESWTTRRPASQWTRGATAQVADFIDRAFRSVGAQFTNEGAVQAMLCTRASELFSTINREAVIGFQDTPERTHTYAGLQDPLTAACNLDPLPKWGVPKTFGGELDLLAVDEHGRLLVIEVKPRSSTAGITWAPLQALFYAELFQAWTQQAGEASAEVLNEMLAQRVALKVERDLGRAVKFPVEVVPVVAIGGQPHSKEAIPRLSLVREALLKAHPQWANLEVWVVEESVRRESINL
jgi:hypothetical protein